MKILGIWPEERNYKRLSSYVALITISVIAIFLAIPQTIKLYTTRDDFNLIVENLSLGNITVTIAVLKTMAFWWHGKTLRTLLSYMEEDRREATTETGVRRMMKIAKFCRTITAGSILLTTMVVLLATFLRFWMNRYTGRTLIVLSYYPYDTLVTPNYEITMIGQVLAGCYSGCTYTVVDTFVAILVFHTCGQFANLRERLHNLCKKSDDDPQAKIAEIVKKHNSLYSFVQTIENLFNDVLLVQMLGCTVLICVQSFQAIVVRLLNCDLNKFDVTINKFITNNEHWQKINSCILRSMKLATITGQKLEILLPQMSFFVVYIAYILFQLYLYCYIGEELHSESSEVIEAAYTAEWYNLPPNTARSFILIMIRARSPLRLTAGKFCSLNHELFSTILRTSMSYLSVLYALKSRREE